MNHRFTVVVAGTLVLILIVGITAHALDSRPSAKTTISTTTTPHSLTLAPVGIYRGQPFLASHGYVTGSTTIGSLPANDGYTFVYACAAPGSIHISVTDAMSVSERCTGRAITVVSWSHVPSARQVRVSTTSAQWRVAFYLTNNPVPLPIADETNV